MKKLPTLTVGIPAFNEEQNIANLLSHLIKQNLAGFHLEKIIVISDGSSDKSVEKAKTVIDDRIQIIDGSMRCGKAQRLNQLFEMTNTDILITIDADVAPHDSHFLQKIASTFIENREVNLVCVKVIPASDSATLITKILAHSQRLKMALFEKIRNISPVYLFIGRAFGYSKTLYKQLKFPTHLMAEDAYVSLFCLKNDLQIAYQNKAIIYYAPPANLNDHLKQSARFYNSESQLKNYFGEDFIKKAYTIPRNMMFQSFIQGFTDAPVLTLLYSLVLIYSKVIVSLHWIKSSYLWETSASSKKVAKRI
jgi:glycosyltransferase involved in cell wall biosynthesis